MNQQTYEKLLKIKIPGMAQAYKIQCAQGEMDGWSFDERFALLVDSEYDSRHINKINRLTKQAKLSDSQAYLEGIHYHDDRGLNRETLLRLAENLYIHEPRNVVLTGATGSGKSYIACALGNNACQAGFKVKYIRLPDLLTELELGKAQDTYRKTLKQYQSCDLLILDEWLLIPTTNSAQQDILELFERRYRTQATIFCSQFSTAGWHERLGGGALADSILDRILPKAHLISILGERSMRSR